MTRYHEDTFRKFKLAHVKVEHDQVLVPNEKNPSSSTILTLGMPGFENLEPDQKPQLLVKTRTIPYNENLDKDLSRGQKRKREEDILDHSASAYCAKGIERSVSRRNGDGFMLSSKASAGEMHKMRERRRRDKFAKKVKILEKLIPNCHKSGRAEVFDQAIEYLRALQHQVHVMSMGRFPAWHSTCTIPRTNQTSLDSNLQLNPYVPLLTPSPVMGSFVGFGRSIGSNNLLPSNLFPMMMMPSTGCHCPILPIATVNLVP